MTKSEFLQQLREKMKGLPKTDIEDRVNFYIEMIDDRIEEGLSEEEAVRDIGNVDEIVTKQIDDTSLTKIVTEKVKPKRRLKAWEIVLIILGFPLWFPLLMFILTMLLVFYIIWWSAVIVLWSIEGSLIMSVFAAIVNMFAFTFRGELLSGFGYFGLSLLTAGLSIFLFMGCVAVTKATFQLMKKVTLKIKKSIIGEEN
jgi:uncharacterized membrane protein